MKTNKSNSRPLHLQWIEAGSLADNPDNWRRHPKGQMKALKTILASDVGWAGALLFNETTGRLIDGHARKDAVDPKAVVPVLVGRWTPEQEMKILATLDPLGAMAMPDTDALESLLADVDLDGKGMEELSALLDDLVEQNQNAAGGGKKQVSFEAKEKARARKISSLYSVIVECKNEKEQLFFYRRMQKEGRKCKLYVL